MKVLGFLTALFGFVFLSNLAYADNITLEMLNKRDDGQKMVYSETTDKKWFTQKM